MDGHPADGQQTNTQTYAQSSIEAEASKSLQRATRRRGLGLTHKWVAIHWIKTVGDQGISQAQPPLVRSLLRRAAFPPCLSSRPLTLCSGGTFRSTAPNRVFPSALSVLFPAILHLPAAAALLSLSHLSPAIPATMTRSAIALAVAFAALCCLSAAEAANKKPHIFMVIVVRSLFSSLSSLSLFFLSSLPFSFDTLRFLLVICEPSIPISLPLSFFFSSCAILSPFLTLFDSLLKHSPHAPHSLQSPHAPHSLQPPHAPHSLPCLFLLFIFFFSF